jgi:hypothetical protein
MTTREQRASTDLTEGYFSTELLFSFLFIYFGISRILNGNERMGKEEEGKITVAVAKKAATASFFAMMRCEEKREKEKNYLLALCRVRLRTPITLLREGVAVESSQPALIGWHFSKV